MFLPDMHSPDRCQAQAAHQQQLREDSCPQSSEITFLSLSDSKTSLGSYPTKLSSLRSPSQTRRWSHPLLLPPQAFHGLEQSGDDSKTSPRSCNSEGSRVSSARHQSQRWFHALFSPVQAFHEIEQSKEQISRLNETLPSSLPDDGFNLPFMGAMKCNVARSFVKEWLKNPMNLALLLWGLAVGVSGALLFLVMTGLLDRQLPSKRQRDVWFEVNNQILNALFMLMCIYLHPQRCFHLVMLLRWEPQDIARLRQLYCKNGTYKPHEWAHMLVVVLLLHLNCFAQYALCGLNWGFKRSQRPAIGIGLCLAVAIGAPAGAGLYSVMGPLGRSSEIDGDYEMQLQEELHAQKSQLERTPSLQIGGASRICCWEVTFTSKKGTLVEAPQWQGGLIECCRDPPVAVLSALGPFCVFGWNMERLGFGNRYVHTVTFILLCTAPYWIFNLAAINIDNMHVRRGLGMTGIILCIFGLLYGGFWRTRMRKTFGLPADMRCFGKAALTDYVKWLFCAPCALCQEVRTSEHYKIRESNFYERKLSSEIPSPLSVNSEQLLFNLRACEASSPVLTPFYSHSVVPQPECNLSAGLGDAPVTITSKTTNVCTRPPIPQVLYS